MAESKPNIPLTTSEQVKKQAEEIKWLRAQVKELDARIKALETAGDRLK